MGTSLPLFDLPHYEAIGLADSGAAKLRASAVAPLVAAARGYAWVPQGSTESYRSAAAEHRLGTLQGGEGRLMKDLAERGGTMLMPLYATSEVRRAAKDGDEARRDTVQFRPENPRVSKTGKRLKYDFAPGSQPPADVHPSVPSSWFTAPAAVVLSEGTLKIDSALTAICRHWGVDDDILADGSGDARRRLHDILDGLPPAARHLCVSFAGVSSWHKAGSDIEMLPLQGPVWIAFDKDVDVNWQVWDQANQLRGLIERRGGQPKLLDLSVDGSGGGNGNPDQDERAGLDDYLAEFGDWGDFGGRLSDEMPPRPAQESVTQLGDWRMNEDTCCAEEYVASTDGMGNPTGGHWEQRVAMIGRIVRVVNRRTTTIDEELTGEFSGFTHEGSDDIDHIELAWIRPHEDEPVVTEIEVPASVAGVRPENWDRKTTLPAEVTNHPDWPPKIEWLKALKAHREDEIERTTAFTNMGWTPSVGPEGPLFFVGDQAIGLDGYLEGYETGCGDRVLAESSSFGMIPPDDADDAREAAKGLIDLLWRSDVFTEPGLAPLVIATALRPIVPIRVQTPVLFTGPPRVGKSWTAAAIMSFWQRRAGTWTENNLPGSVKDTIAASENTMARAAIWVFDDLAPSANTRQAQNEEANLENIVRSCHNGSFKRRMTADMQARTVLRPRALPILTAENALSVSSVMDRCVHYDFHSGTLGSREATDAFVEAREWDAYPSIVAGAVTQWMARQIKTLGYTAVRQEFLRTYDINVAEATRQLGGGAKTTRHAKMAADIYLGMNLFLYLLDELGLTEEATFVRDHSRDFFRVTRRHYVGQDKTSPGVSLLEALRSTLASGAGYILDPERNGPPGLPTSYKEMTWATQEFGWSIDAEGRPFQHGKCIGYYVEVKDTPYVLFDRETAFNLARREHPNLIPSGAKATTSWSSAWDEGVVGGHWVRPDGTVTIQATIGGHRMRGVPMTVERLLDAATQPEDDTPDEPID